MPSLLPDLLQLGGNFYSKDLLTQLRMKKIAVIREVGKRLGHMETRITHKKTQVIKFSEGTEGSFPNTKGQTRKGLLNENQSLLYQPKTCSILKSVICHIRKAFSHTEYWEGVISEVCAH